MIMGTNTPATNQHVGQSYSNVYQQIAKGEKRDDSAFAFVARIDKADVAKRVQELHAAGRAAGRQRLCPRRAAER
jgi:hypothetical protein